MSSNSSDSRHNSNNVFAAAPASAAAPAVSAAAAARAGIPGVNDRQSFDDESDLTNGRTVTQSSLPDAPAPPPPTANVPSTRTRPHAAHSCIPSVNEHLSCDSQESHSNDVTVTQSSSPEVPSPQWNAQMGSPSKAAAATNAGGTNTEQQLRQEIACLRQVVHDLHLENSVLSLELARQREVDMEGEVVPKRDFEDLRREKETVTQAFARALESATADKHALQAQVANFESDHARVVDGLKRQTQERLREQRVGFDIAERQLRQLLERERQKEFAALAVVSFEAKVEKVHRAREELADRLKAMFTAAANELRQHSENDDKLTEIKTTLFAALEFPEAQAAIAHNTNNCGQVLLESVMTSALDEQGRFTSLSLHGVIADVAKKVLESDVHEKINANAFKHARSKNTLLLVAAKIADDADLCGLLVKRGADATVVDHICRNAAMLAAENGHVGVLGFLLKKFGKGHSMWVQKDKCRDNAVTLAARHGHATVLGFLLKVLNKEHVAWAQVPTFGDNAVTFAKRNGHIDVLDFFLKTFGKEHSIWLHQNKRIGMTGGATETEDAKIWFEKNFRSNQSTLVSRIVSVLLNNVVVKSIIFHLFKLRYLVLLCNLFVVYLFLRNFVIPFFLFPFIFILKS